jgi:hypothetical protein
MCRYRISAGSPAVTIEEDFHDFFLGFSRRAAKVPDLGAFHFVHFFKFIISNPV